jgi:hypothetical protein
VGLEPLASLEDLAGEEAPDVLLQEAAAVVADLATVPEAILARSPPLQRD